MESTVPPQPLGITSPSLNMRGEIRDPAVKDGLNRPHSQPLPVRSLALPDPTASLKKASVSSAELSPKSVCAQNESSSLLTKNVCVFMCSREHECVHTCSGGAAATRCLHCGSRAFVSVLPEGCPRLPRPLSSGNSSTLELEF